ncbi:MAG: hypothetical protein OXI41_06025 [Chloroflexota bacterium]|nr:hypothetical protein [Chloroflexota bacterium]MDE2894278.1 hypothetical protein [Chloroflexota bacterium]
MRNRLSGYASRLLIIPLAGIVFAAALGAGFQWGAPEQQDIVRVYEVDQQGRVGSDGAPAGDLSGFVTEQSNLGWVIRVGDSLQTIQFNDDSIVEAMLPIWTDDVQPGDYIVVGGTDDNVNTFITTGIVIIPESQAQLGDAVADAIRADAVQ